MNQRVFEALPALLLPWYAEHHRDLPWRADREPYHVWLSEIMLQQTRVEAVKGYYARFLAALPTIEDLANCDDELLTKLWEGLGYYNRVRNLKKAANVLLERHGGVFPREYRQVLELPGIGPYTAGAICSICFDLPTPAVDGNVLRLVTRLTDDHRPIDLPPVKDEITRHLAEVYPEEAGNFTQALMELGATICGPNTDPDCGNCPCRRICIACAGGTAEQLPVKTPKRQRRIEEKTVLILRCEALYAVLKRPAEGLLAGLWQFPDLEGKREIEDTLTAVEQMGLKPKEIYRSVERKHVFTHVIWDMRGVYMEVAEPAGKGLTWLSEADIEAQIALPTAFRQFWEERDV